MFLIWESQIFKSAVESCLIRLKCKTTLLNNKTITPRFLITAQLNIFGVKPLLIIAIYRSEKIT